MSRSHHHRVRLRAAATAIALLPALIPALAPAQPSAAEAGAGRTGPPLPERVRTLDESLQQELDDLLRRVADAARDRGRLASTLKAQQSAWLQYRDAACALAGMLGGAGDGAAATRTLQCKAEWAEAQRLRLWSALDCIGQSPPAERAAEQERCLQPLVSSARP
jgi:uncharacterized protein YecT (DUF1311 family)